MIEKLNENRAITIIALVITILIMLILCGVTIGPVLIKEGVVEKSKYAKEIDRCAKIEEEKNFWEFENAMKENEEVVSKEDFLKDLGPDNKNLLTAEEQELIRKTGRIIIANKEVKFWNVIGSLSFASENVTLIKDGEGTLKLNEDGLNESDLLWECDNNDIVNVNQGKIVSKNNGKANVTCRLVDDTNIFAKCAVTVVDGSDVYAEGTEQTDSSPLKFCNIPDDCEAIINYSIRGALETEPRHINHMDELRNSKEFRIKDQEILNEGGFYTDWYYRLEDSFGNTTDYYWFYGNFACFTEETTISTPEGIKCIESIKKGDEVYSLNIETKQKEVKKVTQTFKHIVNTEILSIYIGEECIKCTTEHTIYEKNKGWIKAIELKEGNILVNEDGIEQKISKIEINQNDKFINVYNFEVEDNHNYFVGKNKILVHNPPEPTGCDNEGIKYKGESIGK